MGFRDKDGMYRPDKWEIKYAEWLRQNALKNTDTEKDKKDNKK